MLGDVEVPHLEARVDDNDVLGAGECRPPIVGTSNTKTQQVCVGLSYVYVGVLKYVSCLLIWVVQGYQNKFSRPPPLPTREG